MSKQKRDNDYGGFHLEQTEKFAFLGGMESSVCLIPVCNAQIALMKRLYVKWHFDKYHGLKILYGSHENANKNMCL